MDELTTDPLKIADEFNIYFSSIAGKLQKSIYTQDKDFNDYLSNKTDQSFFISIMWLIMKILRK